VKKLIVFSVLLLVAAALGFFVFFLATRVPQGDPIKREFELKISNEMDAMYFSSNISLQVPSSKMYLASILSRYVDESGVFEIYLSDDDVQGVHYWLSKRQSDRLRDCSNFTETEKIKCGFLNYLYQKSEGSANQFVAEIFETEKNTYEAVYTGLFLLNELELPESYLTNQSSSFCSAETISLPAPENLSIRERLFYARVQELCFSDSSKYGDMAFLEPKTIEDFAFYYRGYLNYMKVSGQING
jgi:hypothetical protein